MRRRSVPCGLEQNAGGWHRLEFGDEVFLLHTGEDWDARAMAYFNPETLDGAVAMASSTDGMKTMIDLLSALDPENPIVVAFRAELAPQD